MNHKAIQINNEKVSDIASRLIDDVTQSQGDAEAHFNRVRQYRALLAPVQPRSAPPWPNASELLIPYVKQAKFALLSHFVPALLGVDPLWRVEANNRQSKPFADDIERFLQAQALRHIKARKVLERAFDAALRDGTAIVEVGWRTTREKRQRWQQSSEVLTDEYGNISEQAGEITAQQVEQVTYDAPWLELVTVEHFGTFPRANAEINDSPGVYRRVMMSGQEMLQLVLLGEIDADAVERLRTIPGDNPLGRADDELRGITGSGASSELRFRAQSYELLIIHYRYSADEEGSAPAADWTFILHEQSNILLQAKPAPWWHGKRPFVAISPYLDIEGFYGDSLAAAGAGDVQVAKTTLLRLAVDAMAIGIAPEMLVAQSLGAHIGDIKSRRGPGGVLTMPDSFFDNPGAKMQPFGNQGYSPNAAIALLDYIDREGQESTGVSDSLKGVQSGSGITATEAAQINDSAQKSIAFLSERLADAMKSIGELLFEMNYQYQGNEGPSALWEEINGAQQENGVNIYQAFNGSYQINTNGVRDTSNRAIKMQRSEKLLGTLMNFPQVAQNPARLYSLLFDYVTDSGYRDPERVLGSEREWAEQPAPEVIP